MSQYNDNRSREQRKLFRLGALTFLLLVVLVVWAITHRQSADVSMPTTPPSAAVGTAVVTFDGIQLTKVIVNESTTVHQVAERTAGERRLKEVSAQCAVLPSGLLTEDLDHRGWYNYVPLDPDNPTAGECTINAVVIWPPQSKVAREA